MYVAYIQPLINYAVPAPVTQSSRSIRLELMTNMAMSIILGCSRSVNILNTNKEIGLLGIRDRITIAIKLLISPHASLGKEVLQN